METVITIIGILIFLGGAYFMGNLIIGTFDEHIIERIMSSLVGVLCWIVIVSRFTICKFIQSGVYYLMN